MPNIPPVPATSPARPPRRLASVLALLLLVTLTHAAPPAPAPAHWAFQKPQPQRPPKTAWPDWPRNPIDAFIAAKWEPAGLSPSPEADRTTLLRRASLDLTGLPPSPDDVQDFLHDPSVNAYERQVERLLASPHFGERFAWDWLDAARYADSNGYQGDADRTMWPWRDWVVRAFNSNLPFDEFTVWQLAGDLLPTPTTDQRLATGFCRNHMINGEGGRIPEENRIDYVMDMTETVGTVWMALTLNCSRCHDHKFDPITQREYYQLFAFFNQTPVTGAGGDPQTKPVLELPTHDQSRALDSAEATHKQLAAELAQLEADQFPRPAGQPLKSWTGFPALPKDIQDILEIDPARRDPGKLDKLAGHWKTNAPTYAESLQRLKTATDARNRLSASVPRVMVMEDGAGKRETFVLSKGLYDKPRDKVSFGVPHSLPPLPAGAPANRLGLARWIISPDHPLTARVIVNRFWQQLLGAGLVRTAEDFGSQAEKPTHPELLDWLASEFIRSGWDVKSLCRTIVTSATYRQTSKSTPEQVERDPQNRWLSRGARFRMPSWMLRDQALSAAGLLVPVSGGRSVNAYQPEGVWEEATFGAKKYRQDSGEDLYRRSLYTFWRRIVAPTLFFDNAPRQVCSVKQHRTNTPLHALATLNDTTFVEAARRLAERILLPPSSTPEGRLEMLFRLVLARPPSGDEQARLLAAVARYHRQFQAAPENAERLLKVGDSPSHPALPPAELAAYTLVCATVMNCDEALTRE